MALEGLRGLPILAPPQDVLPGVMYSAPLFCTISLHPIIVLFKFREQKGKEQ